MRYSFTWKGETSTSYGIRLTEMPQVIRPEERVKHIVIPGRSGELTETETGIRGIYEGKTTEIKRPEQWDEWDGRIPQHYYVQILHQMLACEWAEFAVLYACIRYTTKNGERRMMLREYPIERSDVADDLAWLLDQEKQFWHKIKKGTEPPDLLPEI